MTKKELKQELLEECHDDYVGLWRVPWDVREQLGIDAPDEVKKIALDILRELLLFDNVVVGDLTHREFEAWQLSPEESFSRVVSAWSELGREPKILEIGWMTSLPGDAES